MTAKQDIFIDFSQAFFYRQVFAYSSSYVFWQIHIEVLSGMYIQSTHLIASKAITLILVKNDMH